MRTHSRSYINWRNAVLADAQTRGQYVGGFQIRVGEDGCSLQVNEATSDEELRKRPSPPDDRVQEIIEIFLPPTSSQPPANGTSS